MIQTPVNPALPTSAEAAASARQAPSQDIGEQEFLNLLMTQLSNQDPLNPMESAKFMEQVASMNTVQQLMGANERLDGLMLGLTSLNNQSAVDLVGQNVVARGDTLQHADGAPHDLIFALDATAAEVTVDVRNEAGEIVWTTQMTDVGLGEQSVEWPGWNQVHETLPDGEYTFEVHAKDAEGLDIPTTTYVEGVVTELRFDSGIPVLWVSGQGITLDAILRVTAGEDAALEPSDGPSSEGPEPAEPIVSAPSNSRSY